MPRLFSRNKEDFMCKHCGFISEGTGYTNHCPKCLWSMHVDINPGDRKEKCKGMMQPIGVEYKRGEYVLVHRCIKCHAIKKNTASSQDYPAIEAFFDMQTGKK